MAGWLARLLGQPRATAPRPPPRRDAGPHPSPEGQLAVPRDARERIGGRRRILAYERQARVSIRLSVEARREWLRQLGRVYDGIASSPTTLVLERLGTIGARYQTEFRESLWHVQALDPPPESALAHSHLLAWLRALEAASAALIDARRTGDRSYLGIFRTHLRAASSHAASLAGERTRLIEVYGLTFNRAQRGAAESAEGSTKLGRGPRGRRRLNLDTGVIRCVPNRVQVS